MSLWEQAGVLASGQAPNARPAGNKQSFAAEAVQPILGLVASAGDN
jgi:hypothetical protein